MLFKKLVYFVTKKVEFGFLTVKDSIHSHISHIGDRLIEITSFIFKICCFILKKFKPMLKSRPLVDLDLTITDIMIT